MDQIAWSIYNGYCKDQDVFYIMTLREQTVGENRILQTHNVSKIVYSVILGSKEQLSVRDYLDSCISDAKR